MAGGREAGGRGRLEGEKAGLLELEAKIKEEEHGQRERNKRRESYCQKRVKRKSLEMGGPA